MKKVAIQGIAGSFHDIAARKYFSNEIIELLPCDTFKELFKNLRKHPDTIGIVAIENTIAGSLLQNYDFLRESKLQIFGEQKLRIKHNLAALPGQTIAELTEVYSHPIALMQCGEYLDKHPYLKVVEHEDTAASAQMIVEKGMRGTASICSKLAAQTYGLELLAEGIETNKRNFTRFLLITNQEQSEVLKRNTPINKASLVFAVAHIAGALSKVLTILSFYDINLTKIQSLPIIGREWEYLFYIDLTFDNHERYKQSIEAIRPLTRNLQILGEYKEWSEE